MKVFIIINLDVFSLKSCLNLGRYIRKYVRLEVRGTKQAIEGGP